MSKAKKVQSSSQQRTLWQETWRRFKKNKLAVAGMIFLIALVVIAIATIIIDAVNPSIYETYVIKQNLRERLAPPSAAHIFGQDEFGRDMLIRILWSIRSSLFMGALSIALSCIVGGLFGAIAGYYGGKLDNVIMRIMDVFLAIPSMLLAIAIVAAFGTSLVNVLLAIGISYVPTFARTVRAPILTVKGQDYIEAAKAVGASDFRIIFKYILPNSMAPIIVQVTLGVAGAILSIAGLSFLGLGIQPPTPEWGAMLSGARSYIRSSWHITVIPGLAIMLTILALNVMGDGLVQALNGVSLQIHTGKTLGLVGETGAGKTTLAKGIMQLVPNPPGKIKGGEVFYDGEDLLKKSVQEMRKVRGKQISMIFQDPMTSLNPVMTVRDQIMEVILQHNKLSKEEAVKKADEMLELVGIPAARGREYPHQFSGGMKQRVIIAIALACQPRLLIADEPTTALDVTIQAQVLDLIQNLKKRDNTSMLLITHDLGVVAQTCDYVAIMYAGEIVEYGTLREVYKDIRHPYTKGLMASIPNLVEQVERLQAIDGLMPDPTNLAKGCKFADRCKYATAACMEKVPEMKSVGGEHMVRCILPEATEVKEH